MVIKESHFNNGQRFGLKAKTLHIAEDYESYSYRKPLVINRDDYSDVREASASRMRRDVPLFPNNNPNITTKNLLEIKINEICKFI
ncbi:hypothetical protein E2986_12885 [Frieseomelitta varia]|uniref:Uncharacterized protein n=1 Tax=Frieseomelitta varia TaxID=561572 RepID=A0A833RS10_9HYME|nr:hypothetical protein E2986_12885 [Frieseomelitta varia]